MLFFFCAVFFCAFFFFFFCAFFFGGVGGGYFLEGAYFYGRLQPDISTLTYVNLQYISHSKYFLFVVKKKFNQRRGGTHQNQKLPTLKKLILEGEG